MTAIARLKTAAEAEAEAFFADLVPDAARQKAFARFDAAGFPHRRVEAWHYSDLRKQLRNMPSPAQAPLAADIDFARAELAKIARPEGEILRLVLVDGFFVPELSDDVASRAGLTLQPENSLVEADLDALAADPLRDLNLAFRPTPLVLAIAPGVDFAPVIDMIALSGVEGARSRFGGFGLTLGAGARARLLETRAEGLGGFGCASTMLVLGDKAELDYGFRSLHSSSIDVQSVAISLGRDAKLRAAALIADAPFLRRQIAVLCAGEGAQAHLSGALLLAEQNHADVTLNLRHRAAACLSRETFKYVLAERAEGVFQGKISVDAQAQKSDAKMLSRGLLLSDDAAMSSKPELEIFADDVACGHGSACSKLDPNQLFYMESRGLPRAQAQALLIEAFATEAFDLLDHEALRKTLVEDVRQTLAGGRFA